MANDPPALCTDVLVVDDDRDFADSLAELLRLEGYTVTIAYAFEEALETLERMTVGVALVDLRLGRADGVALVREMRKRAPELIAVTMTAYASVETAVEALHAGAYDYLCKPFFTDDLLATLKRCFERSRLREERERALADARARNQELEELNTRLARTIGSLHQLSRADTMTDVDRTLFASLLGDLDAAGGAFYQRVDDRLVRCDATHAGYSTVIALPPPAHSLTAEAIAERKPIRRAAGLHSDAVLTDVLVHDTGEILALPLFDSRGQISGMIVLHTAIDARFRRQDIELGQILTSFGTEVTRLTRTRAELTESEEKLRAVVEHSPTGIALMDLDGRCLLANERFSDWFPRGLGPDRLHDRDTDIVPHLSDRNVIADGRTMTGEVEVGSSGSRRRLLLTRFPVLDDHGRAFGVGSIATDVTERHETAERLRRMQRMEAIGQLTGGVAHDFNNLLAVILGNLRLMEEECSDRSELRELVEDALDAARSGSELTARLLAFGRSQSLHAEHTDIPKLVRTLSRMFERTLGEHITIDLRLPHDLRQVVVDRSQLEASLLNLAINSRDAMPSGGRLTISARNIELGPDNPRPGSEASPGPYVALSVTDTGAGMPPDVCEQAIQPFFTTKPVGQGSGLGLSVVYGFVKQSGGQFDIVSRPGAGTTVTLLFPSVVADAPALSSSPALASKTGSGERILLVEDEPRVRAMLQRQLSRLGYDVIAAGDAREALALLAAGSGIEALLTDVILPGDMDGVRLAEEVLRRHPGLPVVLTTGHAADRLSRRPPPLSQAPVLHKPIEPETLSRCLRDALARRRADDHAMPAVPGGANM